jgi:hypothetical protein
MNDHLSGLTMNPAIWVAIAMNAKKAHVKRLSSEVR